MERIAIDVLGLLPESEHGNKYLIAMDYFTKWPEVFALPNEEAVTVAKVLVDEVISSEDHLSDMPQHSGLMEFKERG